MKPGITDDASLVELLAARQGIVCAVGAGGKKTVLRAIAAAHPGRVAMTGTVPFLPPPESLAGERISGEPGVIAARLAASHLPRVVVYGRPAEKRGRWGGLPPECIREWHERFGFDATLVKADGARMRWIKAPAATEPLLVTGCDTIIPVLSARALGEPLSSRIAHRVELVTAVTGCGEGEVFQPLHAARLLTQPAGLLQGTGDSEVRPVINMVDDEKKLALASEAAALALDMTARFHQVVLTCLRQSVEVVAVMTQQRLPR
ncbi:MAG: selenium cofactor biosynthesis protein YqeC [Gammaproteobacteria bacterium]